MSARVLGIHVGNPPCSGHLALVLSGRPHPGTGRSLRSIVARGAVRSTLSRAGPIGVLGASCERRGHRERCHEPEGDSCPPRLPDVLRVSACGGPGSWSSPPGPRHPHPPERVYGYGGRGAQGAHPLAPGEVETALRGTRTSDWSSPTAGAAGQRDDGGDVRGARVEAGGRCSGREGVPGGSCPSRPTIVGGSVYPVPIFEVSL